MNPVDGQPQRLAEDASLGDFDSFTVPSALQSSPGMKALYDLSTEDLRSIEDETISLRHGADDDGWIAGIRCHTNRGLLPITL
jgi:hypothetical protein